MDSFTREQTKIDSYRRDLMAKKPKEVAAEAALMRGNSKYRPGSMTSVILRWAAQTYGRNSPLHKAFMLAYAQKVAEVKAARLNGQMIRPASRVISGPRKGGPQSPPAPINRYEMEPAGL